MIEEVIENIIQAEKSAEDMVKQAQSQSKDMIANAKDVSVAMIEDEKKRVKSEIDSIINDALLKSEEQAREEIQKCENDSKELEKVANKNKDKAIDYIFGSITKKYDM